MEPLTCAETENVNKKNITIENIVFSTFFASLVYEEIKLIEN